MSDAAAQERATRRLRRFAQQQNGDLRLAQHAALPVVLSPELLHLIRINFLLDEKNAAPPPFTAEVDLLLSPLCREIGDGLYEINPEAREILLVDLVARYGRDRLHEVASLLWQYSHRGPAWADRPGLHRAQQLTALNILDPQQAATWLADAQAQISADAQVDEEWFLVMARERETAQAALTRDEPEKELTDDQARAYERGIATLEALLPTSDDRARQLAVYAERLRAALAAERAYGATATARAEREAIVAQIDTLARTSVGRSFEELCQAEAGQLQPPPMTDEQRADLRQLRDADQRRLRLLEQQEARLGRANAPPSLTREIEDVRRELAEIDARLGQDQPNAEVAPPSVEVAALDAQAREHLLELRRLHATRLYELERLAARQAALTPPEVLLELDEIRKRIAAIDVQLGPTVQLDDPAQLRERLAAHRQNLAQLLVRQAQYGGSTQPLDILNAIEEHRGEIRRIKDTLRAAGVGVEDHPDDEAMSVGETQDTPPDTAPSQETSASDTILQLGIEAAREGNREEARNLFGLLTRQEPDNVQAWLWLAGVAEGPEQRRAALERVLELDPTNEMAIKGLQAMGVEVPPQAETPSDDFETIESLLDGGPVQPEPSPPTLDFDENLQRGIEHAREGNRSASRDVFIQLTVQYPNNAQGWLWLAGVAEGPEERRMALERVLELDPTNEMAIKGMQAMGITEPAPQETSNLDLTTEELAVLERLGVRAGRQSPARKGGADGDTILQLGIDAAREGNLEEARNLFKLLVRQEPDNAQGWLWLAGVAETLVERSTALKQVLELDPANEMAIKGLQAMGISVEKGQRRSGSAAAPPRREMTDAERYAAELDSAFDDYDAQSSTRKPARAPWRKKAETAPRREMTDEELQRYAAELDSAFDDYEAQSSPRLPDLGETFTGIISSISGSKVQVEIPGVPVSEAVGELEVGFARRLLMRKGSSVRVTVVERFNGIPTLLKLKLA
jgi:Tfp pilus assembly protein PilF